MAAIREMTAGTKLTGIIIRKYGLHFDVSTGAGLLRCTLRGSLKREQRKTDLAAVGDRVHVTMATPAADPPEGVITAIEPRDRSLSRLARGTDDVEQVILANPDQMLTVFAIREPDPSPRMIDRFLLIAEARGLDAAICLNKIDLAGPEDVEQLAARFRPAGYPIFLTSTVDGRGIDELYHHLQGKITALAGPSGAGKSSLLNAMVPDLTERTGEISGSTGKGRHTTTWTTLFQLDDTTYVADTPGMRQIGFWGVDFDRLDELFPEFRPFLDDCYYADCRHLDEPDCAVLTALEAGKIHPDRYDSYQRLLTGDDDE